MGSGKKPLHGLGVDATVLENLSFTHPLCPLLPRPLDHHAQGMARLLVVEVSVPPSLAEATSVEALQADQYAFGIILPVRS